MYFESAFYRVNHLSTMENEELKEFLKKAADKCNTDPESFYIYPTCITDNKVFLNYRTSFNQMGRVGDYIENCGLNTLKVFQTESVLIIIENYMLDIQKR